MREKLIVTVTLLGGLLTPNGMAADSVDVSKIPAASSMTGLTYAKDIQPILEKNCFDCHGAEKQKSKYRTDSLEAVIKGGSSDEKAVIAGKSVESPLIKYIAYLVEEMEMPPLDREGKSKKMTDEQIGLIRAWIDQGAK